MFPSWYTIYCRHHIMHHMRATLKHVASSMQHTEGFVLERALIITVIVPKQCTRTLKQPTYYEGLCFLHNYLTCIRKEWSNRFVCRCCQCRHRHKNRQISHSSHLWGQPIGRYHWKTGLYALNCSKRFTGATNSYIFFYYYNYCMTFHCNNGEGCMNSEL